MQTKAAEVITAIHPAVDVGIERLLTINEVAAVLRRSHWTLRGDVRQGRMRCIRIGTRLLFEKSEVQRVIDRAKEGNVG